MTIGGLAVILILCTLQSIRDQRPFLACAQVPGQHDVNTLARFPILCIPGTEYSGKLTPLLCVFATKPYRIVDCGLGSHYMAAKWAPDRKSVLLLPKDGTPLVLRRYDSTKERFGPVEDVANSLANEGVRYKIHTEAFAWSRNGRTLVCAERKQGIRTFDLRTGRSTTVMSARRFPEGVEDLACSPDGKWFAFSAVGKDIEGEQAEEHYDDLWLARTDGTGLRKLGHGRKASWSPSGRYVVVVVGVGGYEVRRYDVETGKHKTLRSAPDAGSLENAAYSPDGRYIAMNGSFNNDDSNPGGIFLTDANGKFLYMVATARKAPVAADGSLEW